MHSGKRLINIAPGKPTDQDSVAYLGSSGRAIDQSRSGIYSQYVLIIKTLFQ